MGSTNGHRTRRRVSDKVFNDPKQNAEILARVTADLDRIQVLIRANIAERVARGEAPVARARPFDLKDFLEGLVKDAVEQGAIYYDAETGYARVRKTEFPKIPAVGKEGWGTAEWEADSHRQFEVSSYEDNLTYALGDARLHALALLWLQAPALDVGIIFGMGAAERALDFGLIANGIRGVPAPVVVRVRDTAPKVRPLSCGSPGPGSAGLVEAWENGLIVGILKAAMSCRELPDARERVQLVIETLETCAGALMPEGVARKFREPSDLAIRRATALMRTLRLRGIKPEFLPPDARKTRGRPKTEWGAARDFARCFGVSFVDKQSRLSRRK